MAGVRRGPAGKRDALADDISGARRLGVPGVRGAPPPGQAWCNGESRRRTIGNGTPQSAVAGRGVPRPYVADGRSFRTGALFLHPRSLEDVRERIIALVTGVLIDRTLRFSHRNLGFPG